MEGAAVRLALRSDAVLEPGSGGRVRLRRMRAGIELGPPGERLGRLLERLAQDGVVEADARLGLDEHQLLAVLDASGWLARHLDVAHRPYASLEPVGRAPAVARAAPAGEHVRLSRFAALRATDDGAVVESPLASSVLAIHDPAAATTVALLSAPRRLEALSEMDRMVADLLLGAGLAVAFDGEHDPEHEQRRLAQWSAADLRLHAEHREADDRRLRGGSFPLADRFGPLAAAKPAQMIDVALPRPERPAAELADPPFAAVLEERRSIREHDDDAPITCAQLGEFLFRAARVRGDGSTEGRYQPTDRPFPSGGAMGELELYPLVTSCSGVAPGLYRYDGRAHGLARLSEPCPPTERLLANARWATATDRSPQVLIVIAARVGRVTWKYERIGYALMLKHVGVLVQTMYLVATAMGLAPCAIGTGTSEQFALASGLDPLEEPSVGEFMLGSAPAASSG